MALLNLKNKKIVISAGASGIGWAIAKVCALKGALIYLCDIDRKALNKVKKHPLYNKRIFVSETDASNETQVMDFFNKIKKKFRNLDALINNAGNMLRGPITDLNENKLLELFHTNVISGMMLTGSAVPHLEKLSLIHI